MLVRFLTRGFYSDDDGAEGGSKPDKVRASDLRAQLGQAPDEQALMRLLEKHADVLSDNADLRAQRRQLKQQLADAQGKQTPEGARILTTEEASLYDAYLALGKPDVLKQQLDTSAGATEELAKLRKAEIIRQAADAAGFKPSVLTQLASHLDLAIRETKEGKPLPVVVADGKDTALEDYARATWADFLPSLKPTAAVSAPNINADARGSAKTNALTDAERDRISDRYRLTF